MASSFEKVMQACYESKKPVAKKTGTAKQRIAEAKKPVAKKKFYEAEETDIIDDTEDADNGSMDDVADDVVVVVDPEVDAEDVDTVAAELQDIVDDTPTGEIPTTDEYVDDYTYGCPICGSTFFSAEEMSEGDECPVCGETPNGFVLTGQVAAAEDTDESADTEADIGDEDLDVDVPEEELEPADDEADEGLLGLGLGAATVGAAASAGKKIADKIMSSKAPRSTGYQLDESTFNPFMTKFIRENYKNAHSFTMKKASYDKNSKALKIECVITMKSGAKKNAVLKVEGFNPNAKTFLAKDASHTFKCEGRTAPFRFSVSQVNRTIRCEGLKYNYVTKAMKEGARLQVSGNLIRESKIRGKKRK